MLAICKRGLKETPAISIFSSRTKLLQYMGILIIKISCSAATSARGKQEEIQKRSPSKEREEGMSEEREKRKKRENDRPLH
jgi:hypothetical protein